MQRMNFIYAENIVSLYSVYISHLLFYCLNQQFYKNEFNSCFLFEAFSIRLDFFI